MSDRIIVGYKNNRSTTVKISEANKAKLRRKTERALMSMKLNDYDRITVNGIVRYEKS